MTSISLPDRILRINEVLAGVPHAFGGAIALAYHAEPRATIDIDVNVFVGVDHAGHVLDPLSGLGVDTRGAAATVVQHGQVRVWWDATPVDLFFAYDPFHDAADHGAIEVPFGGKTIRVLSATHLGVCKAVFDRPKDWVDIEAMLSLGNDIDIAEALRWVGRITGDTDPRYERLAALLGRT